MDYASRVGANINAKSDPICNIAILIKRLCHNRRVSTVNPEERATGIHWPGTISSQICMCSTHSDERMVSNICFSKASTNNKAITVTKETILQLRWTIHWTCRKDIQKLKKVSRAQYSGKDSVLR